MAAMYRPTNFDPPWLEFFHRPCPYQVNKHNYFPQILKLPKELQLMIWEAVIPEPREISVDIGLVLIPSNKTTAAKEKESHDDPQYKLACTSNAIAPAILHATYDSRKVALKTYKLAFEAQFCAPFYVNFDSDIFYFRGSAALNKFLDIERALVKPDSLMDSIKYLWFDCEEFQVAGLAILACSMFGGLKHILFATLDRETPWRPTDDDDIPKVWLPEGDTMEHWKGWVPQIVTNKEFWTHYSLSVEEFGKKNKSGLIPWSPPVVTIGSDTEWDNLWSANSGELGWVLGQEGSLGTLNHEDPMDFELDLSFPSLAYSSFGSG